MTIGSLSRRARCKVETIRYYERIGLMPDPTRTEGGHRMYGTRDLKRLVFIRRGRGLGFSLDESAEIILMYGSPGNNRKQLEALAEKIGEKRQELLERRRELNAMLREMDQAEKKCRDALQQLEIKT